jgi:hypothetical protein
VTLRPSEILLISEFLAAVSVLISSLEVFAYRECLTESGLQSWTVHQVRRRSFVVGRSSRFFDFLFRYPNVLGLLAIRSICAVLLLVLAPNNVIRPWLDVMIACGFWLLYLRCPYGWDGADQMAVIVLVPLAAARWIGGHGPEIALAFIAAQLCVSYWSAGIWKAVSPVWRQEPTLTGILRTRGYGNQTLANFLESRPHASKALGWLVVATEMTVPMALVLPSPYRLVLLFWGLLFHLGTAVLMGLNTFFWSFAAAYPAMIYWASRLTS